MGNTERINRLLSYHSSTLDMMLKVRVSAVERAENNVHKERVYCAELKCAQRLSEYNLKLGMHVIHNNVTYVLAESDGSGNPVGHRIKADGTPNPADRISLFRYRLERITRI